MSILGYWDIRGLANPIRYLLEYLNVEYTNKIYSGQGEEWHSVDKLALNTKYPNIPYFIDGDIVVTENSAISLYLIKKYNRPDLLGISKSGQFDIQEVRVSQTLGVLYDLRTQMFHTIFIFGYNENKDKIKERLFTIYNRLLSVLEGKEYLVDTLTFADFVFYDIINYMKYLFPETKVPKEYVERFESIPQIKKYLSSPDAIKKFLPEYFEQQIKL